MEYKINLSKKSIKKDKMPKIHQLKSLGRVFARKPTNDIIRTHTPFLLRVEAFKEPRILI